MMSILQLFCLCLVHLITETESVRVLKIRNTLVVSMYCSNFAVNLVHKFR